MPHSCISETGIANELRLQPPCINYLVKLEKNYNEKLYVIVIQLSRNTIDSKIN
jgi:hypothetical protein